MKNIDLKRIPKKPMQYSATVAKRTATKYPGDEAVKLTLRRTAGLIAPAAHALGVSRMTLYRWINGRPILKEHYDEVRETVLDMCEGVLFKKIQEGDLIATIFLLKTLGKKRGYVERETPNYNQIIVVRRE